MKTNSLRILALLLAAFTFFSCNKNKDDNDYFVKLKIEGNWVTFKTVMGEKGPDLSDPSYTNVGITANDDAMKDVFDIAIQVDGPDFPVTTYDSDNMTYQLIMSYTKDAVTPNFKHFDIRPSDGRPNSRYLVTISSITDTEIRGSFNGNYLHDYQSDTDMNITEGEFFVKRIR